MIGSLAPGEEYLVALFILVALLLAVLWDSNRDGGKHG